MHSKFSQSIRARLHLYNLYANESLFKKKKKPSSPTQIFVYNFLKRIF